MNIGEKKNFLTLLKKTIKKSGSWYGIFECSCGNQKEIRINAVSGSSTKSCGCHRSKTAIENGKVVQTHGMSKHPLYNLYHNIKQQCNEKSKKYNNKSMCKEWLIFENFKNWCINNGWTINKTIYTESNYYPDFCKIINSNDSKEKNRKNTNLKKYGIENTQNLLEVKEKVANTNINRYGCICSLHNEKIKEKVKNTMIIKYGVAHHMKTDQYKNKFRNITIDAKKAIVINGKTIHCFTKTTGFSHSYLVNLYKKNKNIDFNNLKKKINQSYIETIIYNILLKNNIEFSQQVKINKYFCDFLINDLIIECDGLYWHSEVKRDKDYHINKFKIYKNLGYKSIFFYEDEILNKADIVESIILNKLGKSNKIYARNCEFNIIDSWIAKDFIKNNHVQGLLRKQKYSFGLYFNKNLVSVMTFDKHHRGLDELVLTRFCSLKNTTIVGGGSKLLKNSIKHLPKQNIVSWSDNRYSNGNFYKTNNFNKIRELDQDYCYADTNKTLRIPKQSMKKSSINCPKEQKEHEFLARKGYYRIWDCGKIKWEYINS